MTEAIEFAALHWSRLDRKGRQILLRMAKRYLGNLWANFAEQKTPAKLSGIQRFADLPVAIRAFLLGYVDDKSFALPKRAAPRRRRRA